MNIKYERIENPPRRCSSCSDDGDLYASIRISSASISITVTFDLERSCCEIVEMGFVVKERGSSLTEEDIYNLETVGDRYDKDFSTQSIISWDFDTNPLYELNDDDSDADCKDEITSLDVHTENYTIYVVCVNYHNGYYPHGGSIKAIENGEVTREERFAI